MDNENVKQELSPQEYFNFVKEHKLDMSDDFLTSFKNIIMKELTKAMTVGQNAVVQRLAFTYGVITKERELLKHGISTYVLSEDITFYLNNVKGRVVKIIELSKYPRIIPDEVVQKISELKSLKIFDQFYVVFTDYTGETERQIAVEERQRDPIVFGAFEEKTNNIWNIHDRFYFIADWEDEFCDLTLTKLVQELGQMGKDDVAKEVSLPQATEEEVRTYINNLIEDEKSKYVLKPRKQGFFKSFIKNVRTTIAKPFI